MYLGKLPYAFSLVYMVAIHNGWTRRYHVKVRMHVYICLIRIQEQSRGPTDFCHPI